MKLVGKCCIIFSLFLMSILSFTGIITHAATLGSQLTAPEEGWKRYNDTASELTYHGTGWEYIQNVSGRYEGDGHGQLSGDNSGKMKFKFEGTKLRIIGFVHPEKGFVFAKDIKISIDGNSEHFGMDNIISRLQEQTMVYEKVGLEKTIHTVEIETITPTEVRGMNIDAIDIDEDGRLIDFYTPINLKASAGNKQATLSWNPVEGAEKYTLYFGTESGKYTKSVSVTADAYGNYIVPDLTNDITYFFVVTATVNGVESDYSNEASATPKADPKPTPDPIGSRAILIITMVSGLEKEYDLSMEEVNDFIDWYDSKDGGNGPSRYAIDKE